MDSIPAEEPPSARRTGWIAALAALTVLIIGAGTFWWWPAAPSAPAETPVATGPISSSPPRVRAEREPAPTAEAPRVETPPETPMAKLASPAQAPAPPPGSTRVLTLEAREFRLTVDRPAKPAPAAASPPAADASRITYIVVRGDTLGHIAHRFLGDAARYPELAQLSRIRNPHLIYPGDLVTIDKIRPRP